MDIVRQLLRAAANNPEAIAGEYPDEVLLEWKRVVSLISLEIGLTSRRSKEYLRVIEGAGMVKINSHTDSLIVFKGVGL